MSDYSEFLKIRMQLKKAEEEHAAAELTLNQAYRRLHDLREKVVAAADRAGYFPCGHKKEECTCGPGMATP